jgi:ATP-binding cassette subfamily B (MDR/TAP) protein 1
MSQGKPVSTSLAAHFRLSTSSGLVDTEEEKYMSTVPYACAVGSLMYAMVCTRPDIAHAVSVVSRFMSKPGKEHWKAVQWILRYLRGTSKFGLMFDQRAANPGQVVGYSDSDFAGDLDELKTLPHWLCISALWVLC